MKLILVQIVLFAHFYTISDAWSCTNPLSFNYKKLSADAAACVLELVPTVNLEAMMATSPILHQVCLKNIKYQIKRIKYQIKRNKSGTKHIKTTIKHFKSGTKHTKTTIKLHQNNLFLGLCQSNRQEV